MGWTWYATKCRHGPIFAVSAKVAHLGRLFSFWKLKIEKVVVKKTGVKGERWKSRAIYYFYKE